MHTYQIEATEHLKRTDYINILICGESRISFAKSGANVLLIMRLDFRRLIALWAVAIPYIANQRLPINLSGKCSVAVSCGARPLQSNRALATNIRLSTPRYFRPNAPPRL